ncbi:hypothetical protein ACSHWG_01035 [Leucobacter sp. Z1108]|uniref:hypothetical protein n=1 Tax=Leucobacter sp. Z1108 TaxID=3439066 RepID=UPI003F36A1F2
MTSIITGREAATVAIVQGKIREANASNGWHDRYHDIEFSGDDEAMTEHVLSKLALVGTEVAEAVEELRNGRGIREVYHSEGGKPEGFPIELADTVIRLLDLAGMVGIDLGAAIRLKLKYNASRGKMHGGKRI